MRNFFHRLFTTVIFEDEEKTRTAQILNNVVWVSVFVVALLILSRYLSGETVSESSRYIMPLVIIGLLTTQFLIRRGSVRPAAIFLVVFIWVAMTYQAASSDGLRDVAVLVYSILVLLAAMLLGWREGLVTGLFSLAIIWLFAYQEHIGVRVYSIDKPLAYARDLTAVFIVSSIMTYFVIQRLNRSLQDAKLELRERLRSDEKMQQQASYLSALHETTFGLLNRLELRPLLESILVRVGELLETQNVGIDLLTPDGSKLRQELGNGIFKDWNGTLTEKGVGLTGKVWETGETMLIEDYAAWTGRNPEAEDMGFCCVAGTPLISGNKVLGVLVVASTEKQNYIPQEKVILLERLGALASLAIVNARLYEEAQKELLERKSVEEDLLLSEERLQRQTRYLTALHETTFGLLNRLELNPLLESILLRAGELLNTPHVGIDLVLPDGSELRQELGTGEFAKWNKTTIQLGQGMVGKIWQTGETLLVEDYEAYEDKLSIVSRSGFVTVVGAPMKSGQTVIGTLVVAYRERNRVVTPEEITVLERLAALAALAIDNARLYEEAQKELNERRVIEHELRSSEERFRKVFENNKIAISIVTVKDGIFLEANEAFWELSGLAPEKALGRSVLEFEIWSRADERTRFLEKLQEQGSLQNQEVQFTSRDKAPRTAIAYYELFNIKEQPCILCMFYDITELKQVGEALQSAETRMRAIVASIPDLIFEVSGEGIFLDFLASSELVPVMQPHEFIGRNIKDLFPPRIAEQALFAISRAISSGQDHAFEYGLPPEEEIQFFEARVTPVTEGTAIVMVRDISQRKWVETEREKLIQELETKNAESEALRESMAIIAETLDETKAVGLILEQLEKVVPCDSASVQLLKGDMLEIVSALRLETSGTELGQQYKVTEKEPSYLLLTGKVPYVLVEDTRVLAPLFSEPPYNQIRTWLAVPLRIKRQIIGIITIDGNQPGKFTTKHAELAVAYANQVAIALENARLFSEVQAELMERQRLIEELESKNAELERFTYTVSHDLKSPVITIRGFLGFLEQDALNGNQARLRSDIKRISDATEKMQALLNDLLELSRVGRLVNPPVEVPFNEIVQDALEIVQGQIQKAMAQISVQPGMPMVYVDRPRMVEALQNLIDNAAKFVGEHPRIEIGQEGVENDMLVFYVRDNGMGIASEHHERIFGLFNKLDVDSEGTGVGLALVKRIIEVHKGRIWVQSALGKGTTFRFTLPVPPSDLKPES